MTWENGEDQPTGVIAEVQQKLVQDDQSGTHTVKDEVEALGAVLNDYGFSFFDLAEASPKAEKTKRCCARAVNWMLAVVERILNMRKTHSLPVAAIVKALEIARKIIERHRRYPQSSSAAIPARKRSSLPLTPEQMTLLKSLSTSENSFAASGRFCAGVGPLSRRQYSKSGRSLWIQRAMMFPWMIRSFP